MDSHTKNGYVPLRPGPSKAAEPADSPLTRVESTIPVENAFHREGVRHDGIHFPAESYADRVQFAAMQFFAMEHEGVASIDIIRVGTCKGTCSISYRTVDGSAEAGSRFVGCSGQLVFGPGESCKTINVELIQSPLFDTTLTFTMEMRDPEGCHLDVDFNAVPVFILDEDFFPSDTIEEEIKSYIGIGGHSDVHELEKRPTQLMWEYFKFTFRSVPAVWWKSIVIALLGQLRNLYYLATIFMRVYLIDVILHPSDANDDQLIVPGDRYTSAIILALASSLPHIVIVCLERYIVGSLDMGFAIRKHHRVNFFRKYLNYTHDSRTQIKDTTGLLHIQTHGIPHVVEGCYLGIFDILREAGKIGCVAYFILRKDIRNALPLVMFPVIMAIWNVCRSEEYIRVHTEAARGQMASEDMLTQAAHGYEVIGDFNQRHPTVVAYESFLTSQRAGTMKLTILDFWNHQLVPFFTVFATGLYMTYGAFMVLDGAVSVGTFLATINVYKDLGERFEGISGKLKEAQSAVKPLLSLTKALNLPVQLPQTMAITRRRGEVSKKWLTKVTSQTDVDSQVAWDQIPIVFSNINSIHVPHIRNFDQEVKQGSLVLVFGRRGLGKSHLMAPLTNHESPSTGEVLFPPHQTCLRLRNEPVILPWINLLDNLRFGAFAAHGHHKRVRSVLKNISRLPDNHWLIKRLDMEIAELQSGSHDLKREWYTPLSSMEKKLVHICRAFVYFPQIMVVHKVLDDMIKDEATWMLEQFSEYAHKRHDDMKLRTVFMTCGTERVEHLVEDHADYHWDLERGLFRECASLKSPRKNGDETQFPRVVDYSNESEMSTFDAEVETEAHIVKTKLSQTYALEDYVRGIWLHKASNPHQVARQANAALCLVKKHGVPLDSGHRRLLDNYEEIRSACAAAAAESAVRSESL